MRHEQLIEIADQRGQVTVAEVQAYFDQDAGPGVFTVTEVLYEPVTSWATGLFARVTSENLDHEPETWELCLGVFKPNKDTNHETE